MTKYSSVLRSRKNAVAGAFHDATLKFTILGRTDGRDRVRARVDTRGQMREKELRKASTDQAGQDHTVHSRRAQNYLRTNLVRLRDQRLGGGVG